MKNTPNGVVKVCVVISRMVMAIIVIILCVSTTAQAASIIPIESCRLIDTRKSSALTANTVFEVDVRGECGVPEKAMGIVFNLTVIQPGGTGNLKAYGTPDAPETAVIAYNFGETVVTTGALVWLSADNLATAGFDPPMWGMRLLSNFGTHAVIDITGYLTDTPTMRFQGEVEDKEEELDGTVLLTLTTLGQHFLVACKEPWSDPNLCDAFEPQGLGIACGVGHIGTIGLQEVLLADTMNDCQ